jgi:hypothetical protein
MYSGTGRLSLGEVVEQTAEYTAAKAAPAPVIWGRSSGTTGSRLIFAQASPTVLLGRLWNRQYSMLTPKQASGACHFGEVVELTGVKKRSAGLRRRLFFVRR